MIRESNVSKFIKLLVIAAVTLPLIVIAGVVYVERQQANSLQKMRTEEHVRLRAEAAEAWLTSQAALVRSMANLNAVLVGDAYTIDFEFGSFITAETGFLALGYADSNGKVKVDTSGRSGRDIAGSNYFTEAVAGREYQGKVAGSEWLQSGDVTILATPVTGTGLVTGVVYGVIRQDTIETMVAKLVPDSAGSEPPLSRWFVWLGSVYLTGIIPLLLLVYCLRRSQMQAVACPEVPEDRLQSGVMCQPTAVIQSEPAPTKKIVTKQDELIAMLQQELALASKRSADDAVSKSEVTRQQPPLTPDITPDIIIDRARATRAYKPQAGEKPNKTPTSRGTRVDRKQPADEVASQISRRPQPHVSKTITPVLPAVDAMTGLYSQSEFEKRIAVRKGQPDTVMLVLSIDGLKVINELSGREAGDAIIMATADIIKTVAGSEHMAARVDGDKFVVLLTKTLPNTAEDIKKDVKYHMDLHNLRNPQLPLRLTIGAATADGAEDLRNVWKRAERDMERYKEINRLEARRFIMLSMKRNR